MLQNLQATSDCVTEPDVTYNVIKFFSKAGFCYYDIFRLFLFLCVLFVAAGQETAAADLSSSAQLQSGNGGSYALTSVIFDWWGF